MNVKQTTKGFTIIEVVLVLAIAGLIFLMVFIALPALQSGQRDSARKNDTSIISTAVTNFASQNKSALPKNDGSQDVAFRNYVKGLSSNTTLGNTKVLPRPATNNVTAVEGTATVYTSAKCNGPGAGASQAALAAGKTRDYVVVTYLEGGNGVAYCLEGSI